MNKGEQELRDNLVRTFKRVDVLIGDGTSPEELADIVMKGFHSHMQDGFDYAIGENIQPKMGGKVIPKGKTVTIDMENNLRESCVFVEDNAKYVLQQEQRKRASEYLKGEL